MKELAELYERMLLVRRAEERVIEQYAEQNAYIARGERPPRSIKCPTHLSIGQEAAAVGVCSVLTDQDVVFSTHRCHAHYLAKGGSPQRMMAELYGKRTGCARGKGGSMHLVDTSVGMLGASAILGGTLPLATGAALGFQLRGEHRVAVAFFGDGAVEQGAFHEALNLAAVRRLPVLFVCENNFYATLSHVSTRQRVPIASRAAAYGIAAADVDGDDVRNVVRVARGAVDRAREGAGATLLEVRAYRWMAHVGTEVDTGKMRRTAEELQSWKERCPIRAAAVALEASGASASELARIDDRVRSVLDDAIAFATESGEPEPSELFDDVGARSQT
jgi:acetoin:2,6-dichlorophenolindophenol oxidoreductase subunit alpha